MIHSLMRRSRTNLKRVCEENNLDYGFIYRKIGSKKIELEWLKNFLQMINPEARIKDEFSLSLELDEIVIYNQNQNK